MSEKLEKSLESGWYWAKPTQSTEWQIVYYYADMDEWWVIAVSSPWQDKSFRIGFIINENRIKNPDEK